MGCRWILAVALVCAAGWPSSAGAQTPATDAVTISGHVTDASTGAPLTGGLVEVVLTNGGVDVGSGIATPPDGSYSITNVTPGVYFVEVRIDPPQFIFAPPHTTTVATRTLLVSPGSDIQLDIAVSSFSGSIAGTLTPTPDAAASSAVGGGSAVLVYDRNGNQLKYGQVTSSSASSRWPATYVVSGLAPGTYYLKYVDELISYRGILYGGGGALSQIVGFGPCVAVDCDVRRGTPIQVGAGAVTGIDIPVVTAGSIALSKISFNVELYDSRGVLVSPPTFDSFSGLVFLTLPPDTYFLRWVGADCTDCAATSLSPIQVHAGERVTVDSGPSDPSRRISGTIRDSMSMTPLGTIAVRITDAREPSNVRFITTDMLGQYTLFVAPGTYIVRTENAQGYVDKTSPLVVGASDIGGVDFALDPAAGLALESVTADGAVLSSIGVTYFDSAGHVAAHTSISNPPVSTSLAPGTYFARTDPAAGLVMQLFGGLPCASGRCDPTGGTPITLTGATPATVSFSVPRCGAPEVSPGILASAVVGRPYRQAFTSSHPSSGFLLAAGTLPSGMSLDAATGVLAGTPGEGGVFFLTIAAVDGAGCAGIRTYTLQVAKCAFTLSPQSATVSPSGATFDIIASDVCGLATVTAADPWVTVSASSIATGVPLHVTVAPSPSTTARTTSIVIGRRIFDVRQPGRQPSPPFGSFDAPVDGSTAAGSVAVVGWALDDVEVTHVRIYRDAVSTETGPLVFIGDAVFTAGARPDVERAYPNLPFNARAGWGYLLLTNMLPDRGDGTFRLHAIAEDAEGNTTELGTKTIVATNTAAIEPFGGIDTPGQGEIVSGPAYVNFGWALTPRPKDIPTDGSTIHVLIDGVDVGTASYNHFRSDVSTLFPGLANSGGPVAFFVFDTTQLAEGLHTIAWVVTDSTGVTSGIGSRFFTVRNSADAPAASLRIK